MSTALVIDDNRQTADALHQMLVVLGVEARVAYGSSPAITLLRTTTPNLILLDINMPGVDGLEIHNVCISVRNHLGWLSKTSLNFL